MKAVITGQRLAVLIGMLSGLLPCRAATVTKTNNVDHLNLSSSWVEGVVPGAGDVAQWNSTVSGESAVSLGADLSWAGIRIANPGGAVTIGAGNVLTLGAAGIDMGSATTNLTISAGMALLPGSKQLWNVASGRRLTLDTGAFTRGAGAALTMQGSGSVAAFTVANDATGIVGPWACLGAGSTTRYITMSGGLFANYSGTVVANASGVTDVTGVANYEVGGVGAMGTNANFHTLRYTGGAGTITNACQADGLLHVGTGALTFSGPVTIGASRELVVNLPVNNMTLSAPVSNNVAGASALTKVGSAQLSLSQGGAFTGPITVGEGTLQVLNPVAGGSHAADIAIGSASYLQYNSGSAQTFSGVISGGGNVHKWNGGQLTMTGSNSFSGITAVYAGIVRLGHSLALGSFVGATQLRRFDDATRGRVELNGFSTSEPFSFEDGGNPGTSQGSGGYLENSSVTNSTLYGPVTLTKHGTFRGTGTMIIRGVASGNGNFVKDGSGTVNIETNATFTGNVTVSAGTLHVTGNGLLGGGSYAGNIALAGAFIYNGVATQTLSGVISGGGTLLKWRNEGVLILSGANSFSGLAQLNAGLVKLASAGALGTAAGATEIRRHDDGNRSVLDLNGQAVAEPLKFEDNGYAGSTLGSGGILENGDTHAEASCSGAVTLNKHGTVRGNGNVALTGAISGAGRLIKQGTNTLTISGANSYTGATVVAAGTLRLGANGTLPDASDVILFGGSLDAGSAADTAASLTVAADSTLALGTGRLTFGDSRGKTWAGTLTLTGTLGPDSLYFPDGLTIPQVLSMSYNGSRVYLTQDGHIVDYPPGTQVMVK